MILLTNFLVIFLLEWIKKILFETAEEKDESYAWLLSGILFIVYLLFVLLFQPQPDPAYEYDGGYVIRPHDVQTKYTFRRIIFSSHSFLLAIAIVFSVIHTLKLKKHILKEYADDYIHLASILSKLLLFAPYISAVFILLATISSSHIIGYLVYYVLIFYVVGIFVIHRVQSRYDFEFAWGRFWLKFLISNLISIFIVVAAMFIAVINTDFSH